MQDAIIVNPSTETANDRTLTKSIFNGFKPLSQEKLMDFAFAKTRHHLDLA